MRALILALFFVSGAAGLVYEVTWARSLGLVFGASHLAIATVLAVYMGGQALGSALLGGRADRTRAPLRLYGLLELGVGASAVLFVGLMRLYPDVYRPLAQIAERNTVYLTVLRATFAVVALALPTTLMGGTLPTLTRFAAHRDGDVSGELSFLYAFNTLGAVAGATAAGFVLLPGVGVTASLLLAAALSAAVGAVALLLQRRSGAAAFGGARAPSPGPPSAGSGSGRMGDLPVRLALLGIGVSGFCALGYEVLWTRMLSLVLGTSVYSFTVMLVAFLAGIGAGSHAHGLLRRRLTATGRAAVLALGATQVAIGLGALAVTILMRDLPRASGWVQGALAGVPAGPFGGRIIASTVLAMAFMFVPAFFMGMAFPVAGAVCASGSGRTGVTVGRLLTVNTVGAILGALMSGYALIPLFRIERSLHMLVVLNLAAGLAVAASLARRRWPLVAVGSAAAVVLVLRGAFPEWGRAWNQKYLATFSYAAPRSQTAEQIRKSLEDVDVLYYDEGINETVAVTRAVGIQSFIVNGRPEASSHPMDVQCQRTLGHVPMLLHPDPRKVFVLGTGSGMTLGAVARHPGVQRIVLAEIEKGVLGVARAFAEWNGNVLDDPRLDIVFNDGRNYLATTREKFDVITADPIHPWSGGAAYLYTREYFHDVSERLAPGGIACQWLPLYELTTRDVRTVLRTFSESFRHVMVWLSYYDAEIVGSNDPIAIDEAALARRMSLPAIRDDLAPVYMGTVEDLLSYFVMGDSGARAFARGGDLNTDDNLLLEFSAPASQGVEGLDCANVAALGAAREGILPYLVPAAPEAERAAQLARWSEGESIARSYDPVHAGFMCGDRSPALESAVRALQGRGPGYAPLRFLLEEKALRDRSDPELVADEAFRARSASGSPGEIRVSVVRQYLSRECVLVSIVDNARREIYAQRYVCGDGARGSPGSASFPELDAEVGRYAERALAGLRGAAAALAGSGGAPAERELAAGLRAEAARLPTGDARPSVTVDGARAR